MTALQDAVKALTDEVAAEKTVEDSAVAAINGLIAAVQAGLDQGSLQAVQDAVTAMKANVAPLAAAVASVPA